MSGGEAQRVKMVRHLGSALSDVTYVFDEPTVGLHPHDIDKMVDLLQRLRDKGNTVLVVEHKPQVVERVRPHRRHRPRRGRAGRPRMFTGDRADGLRASGTITGEHLSTRHVRRTPPRTPTGALEIRGATTHNLRGVDADIPLGVADRDHGRGGIRQVEPDPRVDRRRLDVRRGHAARGRPEPHPLHPLEPATYTGLLDPIRTAFAKANKVKLALFSANSAGARPNCKGLGIIYTDLGQLAGCLPAPARVCEGRRFTDEVLRYTLHRLNISEVLQLPVADAAQVFHAGSPGRDPCRG